MNRRNFLKLCGFAAYSFGFEFGISGCANFPKDVKWSDVTDREFSIDKFNDWFEAHKLYNGVNPNLGIGRTGKGPTFYMSMKSGWSPGIDYSSNYMYAVADGIIAQVGKRDTTPLGPHRMGGNLVRIAHDTHTHGATYTSIYPHLLNCYVKVGDLVKRGDKIGDSWERGHEKLMFVKNQNLIDPDNYGVHHSYMTYWDGKDMPNENIDEKNIKQAQIVGDIAKKCSQELKLWPRDHTRQNRTESCVWDQIEMFRYLTELYSARPKLFPSLTSDRLFNDLKKEFYANQPIILTLPLKA